MPTCAEVERLGDISVFIKEMAREGPQGMLLDGRALREYATNHGQDSGQKATVPERILRWAPNMDQLNDSLSYIAAEMHRDRQAITMLLS